MIEPPSYLTTRALPAWTRVTERVAARGWDDSYSIGCFVIASQSVLYLDCVKLNGPQHPTTRETHLITRQWMHDFFLIDDVMNVRCNDDGVDLDILELCEPLDAVEREA